MKSEKLFVISELTNQQEPPATKHQRSARTKGQRQKGKPKRGGGRGRCVMLWHYFTIGSLLCLVSFALLDSQ